MRKIYRNSILIEVILKIEAEEEETRTKRQEGRVRNQKSEAGTIPASPGATKMLLLLHGFKP
jgi:hypothetical protein